MNQLRILSGRKGGTLRLDAERRGEVVELQGEITVAHLDELIEWASRATDGPGPGMPPFAPEPRPRRKRGKREHTIDVRAQG